MPAAEGGGRVKEQFIKFKKLNYKN